MCLETKRLHRKAGRHRRRHARRNAIYARRLHWAIQELRRMVQKHEARRRRYLPN